jgi:hypothetical protein
MKFASFVDGQPAPFRYGDIWERQQTSDSERLAIAPSRGHVDLLIELSRCLGEPFGILYVLLVSWPVERREMEGFVLGFRDYFESDGRHHLWLHSVPDGATLIYDQHDVLYAYGPLDLYEQVLRDRGLREGAVEIPVPHQHAYHRKYDVEEDNVMGLWEWRAFPLAESD